MEKIKKYDNGLTLIVSEEPALSTSFAIMVGVGNINETDKTSGISHYIEHMNFKGTKKFTAFDISNKLEYLGSSFNAYTSAEVTCYYAQSLPENTEKTFEIFTDAVFNSIYPDEEAIKEKQVILEEIKMSEDTPDDVCRELVTEAYYGNNGYGRSILGNEKNVLSFTSSDVNSYVKAYYIAKNTVITFAGVITFEKAQEYVEKHVLPYITCGEKQPIPEHNVTNKKLALCKNKDIEQCHIYLTFPSNTFIDENKIASDIAINVLGGGMSSRLFMKVREELGLAYSVYAFSARYLDSGTLNIYAGVGNDKVGECYDAIKTVIDEAKKGISDEEFEKVRNSLKAGSLFSQERPSTKVQLFSKYYLLTGKLYDFKQRIKAIDDVKKSDVIDALNAISTLDMASAIVGKDVKPLI